MVAQLFVKSLSGKTIVLNVSPNTAICTVKQMLHDAQGIPIADQRLIVGGKQLEDGKTLADYNITSNSSVDVMLRLLGGLAGPVYTYSATMLQLIVTLSSYGNAGAAGDTFLITIKDNTNYTWTYSTTISSFGPTAYNWSVFSGSPSIPSTYPFPGDGIQVKIDNTTAGHPTSGSLVSGNFANGPDAPTISPTPTSSAGTFFVTVNVPSTNNNVTAIVVKVYAADGTTLLGTQTDNSGNNTGAATWPLVASTAYVMQITTASLGYTLVNSTIYRFAAQITNAGGTSTQTSNTAGVAFVSGGGGGGSCFLAHSKLFTPTGYKAAKDIKTGDLLVTADGRKVPVNAYSFTVETTTEASAPFVIYKDAFRKGYPKADLYLSPEHAIMIKKDLWTMAKWLQIVAPDAVKQYDVGKSVTYYHFETPNYFKDNFVCEGTVVESFAANQLAGMKGRVWSFSVQENGYKRLTAKPPVKAILM